MCGKHVAERPRRKIRATLLVTVCVLAVGFAFLTWLYHFDDGAQERSRGERPRERGPGRVAAGRGPGAGGAGARARWPTAASRTRTSCAP